jgi:hypothetical protein
MMFAVLALLTLFGSVILNLISSDIDRGMPSFARWLIALRAAKLPSSLRERMHEEWLADMEAFPTHVQKLFFAAKLFKQQAELLRAHEEQLAHRNDVTVALTGVEAKTSVANITPSTGDLGLTGHAPTVVIGGGTADLSVALIEHVSVSDSIRKPFFGNTDQSSVAMVEHWRAACRQSLDSSYSLYIDSNAILFLPVRSSS